MILGCCVIVVVGICLLMADSARPHGEGKHFTNPLLVPVKSDKRSGGLALLLNFVFVFLSADLADTWMTLG